MSISASPISIPSGLFKHAVGSARQTPPGRVGGGPPNDSPGVLVELSPRARAQTQEVDDATVARSIQPEDALAPEALAAILKLRTRDAEVRAHERAHAAAGGELAGAPQYVYQQGPDGRRYAIGGSVAIDLSPGQTPEDTLRRAERVRAAALAPAQPSGQDLAVAGRATQIAANALVELAREQRGEAGDLHRAHAAYRRSSAPEHANYTMDVAA